MSLLIDVPMWDVACESVEWVGPLVTVVTVDGLPIPVLVDDVEFALVPRYSRPSESDWLTPAPNPEDALEVGIIALPVSEPGDWGIWGRISNIPVTPIVVPPNQIGWVRRV